ncbi:MAG: hypothetical protein J6Q73_03555 [Bacteroidaceae bacterium]|nr:hypothetical protein [Bacteroidaceae bacterium]
MKQRILSTIFVLMAFVGITRSQTLSVEPLSLPAGAEGEIVVGLSGATTMTALQFCINIPNGYELNSQGEGFGAVLGNATRGGHTVKVQQVGERNYLVVVYSMHLNTFANGELVKIPVVASGEGGTATGSLYNIRMANKNAESFECERVEYAAEVKYPALAVEPVMVKSGEATNLEVNISNASAMAALQFCLSLPNGVTLASESEAYGIEYKNVYAGHKMSIQPLASGDYLVVLYNIYRHPFRDGALLTIPVTAGENGGTVSGSLYNVRMSTADAVSYQCEDATVDITIDVSTGIEEVKTESGNVKGFYDLQGRKVENPANGIYIVNGKKVLIK